MKSLFSHEPQVQEMPSVTSTKVTSKRRQAGQRPVPAACVQRQGGQGTETSACHTARTASPASLESLLLLSINAAKLCALSAFP